MTKKGQYDLGRKALYLIVVIFFLTIMFIYLNTTFGQFDLKILKATDKVTSELIAMTTFISPQCFAYVEPSTGRAYPGIIDLSRFKNDSMYKTCGLYYEDKFAAYLLMGDDLKDMPSYRKTIKKSSVHKVGKASVEFENYFIKPVVIKSGSKMERGALIVGIDSK